MTEPGALWTARLHHLQYASQQPEALVAFYRDGVGMTPRQLTADLWLLSGGERRLLVARGKPDQPFSAFAMTDRGHLDRYKAFLQQKGVNIMPSPTPLFADGAFAVADPDGRELAFGLPRDADTGADPLPGRLQHVVVATIDLEAMMAFYIDRLGFLVSDVVYEDDAPTACFVRSDPEHHSIGMFRAPEARPDHHSYEATSWNDIRDWADHFAAMDVPIWWGPGRHGPGNNLFFMVQDPDGNLVEISAELELMDHDVPHRTWPHEERTLNLWGPGFMRS